MEARETIEQGNSEVKASEIYSQNMEEPELMEQGGPDSPFLNMEVPVMIDEVSSLMTETNCSEPSKVELQDHHIICSNGIPDPLNDTHPGNVRLNDITRRFLHEWYAVRPEQRNQILENEIIGKIKHRIKKQQRHPSFLTQKWNKEWREATDDESHHEIQGVWRRNIFEAHKWEVGWALFVGYMMIFVRAMGRGGRGLMYLLISSILIRCVLVGRNEWKELDVGPNTLSTIERRGRLICGVSTLRGFASKNKEGIWEGFEVDLCRAVAAGIFGKDKFHNRQTEPVDFVPLAAGERFSSLNDKTIDLLVAMTSQNIERSLHEVRKVLGDWCLFRFLRDSTLLFSPVILQPKVKNGFTFSLPYLVSGLTFAGMPDYLNCVASTRRRKTDFAIESPIKDDFCQSTRVSFVLVECAPSVRHSLTLLFVHRP